LQSTPHLLQKATFGWFFCWGKKHHSNDDLRRAFEYSIHVVPVKSVAPVKDAALIPTTEFIGEAK
jgi:hypothetical protein